MFTKLRLLVMNPLKSTKGVFPLEEMTPFVCGKEEKN